MKANRDLEDIFALQDRITVKVLSGVQVKLTEGGDVAAEVLGLNPEFKVNSWAKTLVAPYKDRSQRDKIINAARKSGLK